ncbi:hypothetical protein [Fluviicola chungangensis]|uniref:Uncharacterized protein n=1 Tax=Fluviicola chungangensis TaxID=2597671 RepID=A0A556MQD3_9FLAO|nr:hypothetical protein [Fluviicola chungangensis]TSJ41959.1 hypothetical protein FO442_12775 [Fluviicola chungangensis]
MNLKHVIIPAVSIALFIFGACGGPAKKDYSKEVDEGTFDGNKYTSQALGWTMEFPDNWIITSKSSLESLDERSKASVDDTTSDMSGIKRTLAFQKNFENNFQSSWEDFSGDEASYKRIVANNHQMIYNNYLERRMYTDTVAGKLTISGVTFDTFEVSINDREAKVFATQLLMNALVKGKFMTVTISYNNEADKKKMLDLFKKSTFK